ncbi:MAG: response regulator [Anaerolineales bacterium]|nr:MAG: response regulator [Anaerolineales bacterium]
MNSIEGIRRRLENLFSGISKDIPKTGTLSTEVLGSPETDRPRGWSWEIDSAGRYTWCSPEVEKAIGMAPDDLIGKEIYSSGFNAEAAAELNKLIDSGQPIQHLLMDFENPQGEQCTILLDSHLLMDKQGLPKGYRGISQIVEAERSQKSRMAVTLPIPPDSIDAITVPELAASWGQILGYEDDRGNLRPIDDLDQPIQLIAVHTPDRLVIPLRVQDEIIGVIELDGKDADDPWTDEDRVLAEAVAHEFAITLQDARSHQLTSQALEEMREADRLKSQFLANMSHELRTPLNSIIGFSRVILKGIDGPVTENQEQDLSAIYNAGQHLLGLINDILDLSKIEAGKMELTFSEVDLPEIIRGVMSTAVGLVKDKPIELVLDLPDDLPSIQADNIRLRQILLNLVSNATKFTDEGHIGISVRLIERGSQPEIVIAVFDTGHGIPPEDHEKIFEPFSQVDASPTRKTGGTGLGLSICKHLVELHRGVLWVESLLGEGSTFAFTIPYEVNEQEKEELAPLILCVDRDSDVAYRYRRILEDAGYRFHVITKPSHTFELAKAIMPDAILLDLLHPDPDVWQIMTEILGDEALDATPILLTEYDKGQGKGVILDITRFLTKPVRENSLRHILQTLNCNQKSTFLLVEEQPDESDRIRVAIEGGRLGTVLIADSLEDASQLLDRSSPEIIILSLTYPGLSDYDDDFFLQKIDAETPIIGILPGTLTSSDLKKLINLSETLKEVAIRPSEDHNKNVAAIIKRIAPRG